MLRFTANALQVYFVSKMKRKHRKIKENRGYDLFLQGESRGLNKKIRKKYLDKVFMAWYIVANS